MKDAELIKGVRQVLGITQTQFAAITGFSKQAITFWETGLRNPKPEVWRNFLEKVVSQYLEAADRVQCSPKQVKRLKEE